MFFFISLSKKSFLIENMFEYLNLTATSGNRTMKFQGRNHICVDDGMYIQNVPNLCRADGELGLEYIQGGDVITTTSQPF